MCSLDVKARTISFKAIDERIYFAEEHIKSFDRNLEATKEDGKKRIWSIKNQVNEVTSQIEELAAKIVKKQKYIALGKEKLAEYWFASRCAKAGMRLECDPQLLEARDEIYAKGQPAK